MKADAHQQWKLLDLQKIDTRLAQIRHRRTTLPQEKALQQATAEHDRAHLDAVRVRTARDDVQRELDKAEADVRLVRDRADRDRSRIESGQGSAKDVQALTSELESLERRSRTLEDAQLEVMERAEALSDELFGLERTVDEAKARVETATKERDAAVAELDAEEAELGPQRENAAAGLDAPLLALYERILAQTGMGAAELVERRCTGCMLELMGQELRAVAAAAENDVVRCEECNRILVRTGHSGL